MASTGVPVSEHGSDPSRVEDARWKLAFEANGDGVWDWDIPSGRVDFSPGLKTMLGYSADAPWSSVDDWARRVHPDDLSGVMRAVQAHLDGETAAYSNVHRLACADGTWKWILDRGLVLTRDDAGKPVRMLGSHTDVSESRRANEALDAKSRLLETVLENAPVGFALYETNTTRVHYVSRRFEEICGIAHGSLEDRSQILDLVFHDPAERTAFRSRVMADLASDRGDRLRWDDIPLTLANGQQRWITAVNIRIPDQHLMITAVQDVTDSHQSADAMHRQTEQLRERNADLVRFNRATVDRELRMGELKQEINALLARLGEPARYDTHE